MEFLEQKYAFGCIIVQLIFARTLNHTSPMINMIFYIVPTVLRTTMDKNHQIMSVCLFNEVGKIASQGD